MKTKQGSGWANRTRCKKKNVKQDKEKSYIYGKSIIIPITIIKRPVEEVKHWKDSWKKEE